jgi:hypothetical protein
MLILNNKAKFEQPPGAGGSAPKKNWKKKHH